MRLRCLALGSCLLVSAAVFAPGTAPAGAAATCSIAQVTETTGGDTGGNFATRSPAISGDGSVITFASDRNFTGSNGDANQEIFRFVRSSSTFTQITTTTGGTFTNRQPQVNGDGNVIAFNSDRNIGAGNPELNREVFRWVAGGMTGTISPVTSTTAGTSTTSDISAAGDRIAFTSDADIAGQNADGNREVYVHASGGPTTTQVTTTTGADNYSPDLNGTGTLLAFGSEQPFGAANADGSPEVFLRNLAAGTTVALTNGLDPVESHSPELNGNGRRVVFTSDGTFAGRNPDGNEEAILHETTARATAVLTASTGETFGLGEPSINGAGSRVALETDADLTGGNADGLSEVFLRDFSATGPRITQVTSSSTEGSGEADLDASGTRVVFSSRGDLTGDNADGNREIFLATCTAPPAASTCDGALVTVERGRGQQPTVGNDVIRGTNAAETVNGAGGNDRYCGLNGNDTFNGGPGNDRAFGQNGNDRLRGDGGDDLLDGGANADTLNGGPGPDTCRGGPGTDAATNCTVRLGLP